VWQLSHPRAKDTQLKATCPFGVPQTQELPRKMDFSQFGSRPMNLDTLLKRNQLTPDLQSHVASVYAALTATVLAAAAGVYTYLMTGFGGFFPGLVLFGTMFWLGFTRGKVTPARLGGLLVFGFCQGLAVGPLVNLALDVDPGIVITAFLGTAAIFISFSLAALVAKRREYLYLGGLLGSAISMLFWAGLANMFFRSRFIFNVELVRFVVRHACMLVFFCGQLAADERYGSPV
jgi:Bax inhibitor 1